MADRYERTHTPTTRRAHQCPHSVAGSVHLVKGNCVKRHTGSTRLGSSRFRRLAAIGISAGVLGAGLLSTTPASAATGGTLARIKACESGGSYRAYNASSGASGAYQFLNSTWRGLSAARGYATAGSAPPAVQDRAAQQLYAQAGSTPWNASASCWRSGSGVTRSTTRSYSAASPRRAATSSYRSRSGSGESADVEAKKSRSTASISHGDRFAGEDREGGNTGWGGWHRHNGGFEHED